MPEIIAPEDMLAEIRELQRRIKDLETAPQSNRAVLDDGNFAIRASDNINTLVSMSVDGDLNDAGFRVYTNDGVNRLYLGTFNDGTAAYLYVQDGEVIVKNSDVTKEVLDIQSDVGVRRPVIPVVWQMAYSTLKDSVGHPFANSGSYEMLWTGWINCSTHVYYEFTVNLQGSVTGAQYKITCADYFGIYGGSGEQVIHENTTAVDVSVARNDLIPAAVVSGAVPGSVLLLRLYARITAGSGSPGVSMAPMLSAIPSQG